MFLSHLKKSEQIEKQFEIRGYFIKSHSFQVDPNKDIQLDVSSTSSDSDTEYLTPLTEVRKQELIEKERELEARSKKAKADKKKKKKELKKQKKKKKKKER